MFKYGISFVQKINADKSIESSIDLIDIHL